MIRALTIICGVILFTACDDGPKVHPDADGDVDVPDMVDVQDADADVDVPDWPDCTPWISDQTLPEGSLVELPLPDPNGEGDLYPNSIYGNLMVLEQIYNVFLVNLETFDATSILPSYPPYEFGFNRQLAFNVHISGYGMKRDGGVGGIIFDTGIYLYNLSYGSWTRVLEIPYEEIDGRVTSYAIHTTPSDYITVYLLYTRDPTTSESWCDLNVINLSSNDVWTIADHNKLSSSCGKSFMVNSHEVAYCGINMSGSGLGVFIYNTETRTQVELDTLTAGHCGKVSFFDENQVLFETSRTIRGRYQGEVVEAVDYDVALWNRQNNSIVPLSDDPWWSQLNLLAKPPLAVYRDHRVFCFGYPEAGVNASDAAYMVLHDLETGVKRPIPYPASPMDSAYLHVTVPLGIMEAPWRLVFGDYGSYHDDPSFSVPAPPIYILNLETAGMVDETGHVIPDPTFPPVAGN